MKGKLLMDENIKEIELLKKEIDELSYDIYVDSYPMSLSELISLYKENDINLKAEYQRVFKWTPEQKTKFIESLLLGLPIPPIFLYQGEDALWEVVDGIQRLSTIFEFVGILKDLNNEVKPELILTSAPKLTYLEGLKFSNFPKDLERTFRKCKLDLIIISKKSKKDIKLEVFRRLNGFGTKLNSQELRNALALLIDSSLFTFLDTMSNNKTFLSCLPLKDTEIEDKKHYEYFIRFLTLYEQDTLAEIKRKGISKAIIDDLFDQVIENIADQNKFNRYNAQMTFIETFDLLYSTFGENVFKKYDHKKEKFQGPIRESIFEAIIPGVSKNIDYYKKHKNILTEKILNMHLDDSLFKKATSKNPKAIDRMSRLLNISIKYFEPNE
ncbi:DUF262 domain-containing protein [Clostridioides difficile]